MKITAGLGSADEYIRFVEAGADEFFSGFVPYSWTEKYGTVMPLNRREVLCYHVQLGAFSELEILSEMIRKYKKPVHLTFNSLYYIPQQYPEIVEIIENCMKLGFMSYMQNSGSFSASGSEEGDFSQEKQLRGYAVCDLLGKNCRWETGGDRV